MKKSFFSCKCLFIISIFFVLLFTLTGCDFSKKESNNENSKKDASTEQGQEQNQGTDNTENNVSKKVADIRVVSEEGEETKHWLVISGLDKDTNVVWTYKTGEFFTAQYDNAEYLGDTTDFVVVNEEGTLKALNKETGDVIWTNSDYKGFGSYSTFDDEGYLYLSSCMGPSLFVVSPKGETLTRLEIDNYASDPTSVLVEDGYVRVSYPIYMEDDTSTSADIYASTRDIKNTANVSLITETPGEFNQVQIGGFESVHSFSLNDAGTVTVTFDESSEIYNNYPNGQVEIDNDVKSISPVFWGNGGFGTLVMVHKDGQVSVLDSMNVSMGDLTVRKLEQKDIRYVIQINDLDGAGYGLVDASGNISVSRV